MKMIKYFLIICLSLVSIASTSQTVEGVWETYDHNSGALESDVKIYIKDGKLYGKTIKFYNAKESQNTAKCTLCKDYRKNQPLVGMVFMTGLVKSGKEWKGSKVLLDPNNGKEYDGEVWLVSDDKLAVRGYLGWFYQTQYWKRKK
ncbi:MAG TPA: DUF2147 domain-containing protein [Brumimicrobium sp.]|nr:DUF2147 domain-containing protein [Brumimicrobium sp.]